MARNDVFELPSLKRVVAQPSVRGSLHQLLRTWECEPCRSQPSHRSANVCLPLSLVQGHQNPESHPIRVFLLKSKRRDATYCCSDWDRFCIWQDSCVNLCNKVILTLCILCYQVKKITDLIDKTLFFGWFLFAKANIWKFNVFIFIFCVCESKWRPSLLHWSPRSTVRQ